MRWMPTLGVQLRSTEALVQAHVLPDARGLNVGSKRVRFGPGWTNLDVSAGPEVDVVGDAHHLPFPAGSFDAVVLSAILQYCRNPFRVVDEVARVLRPRGVVIVNAPFLQPCCPEPGCVDRFRFTQEGLVGMFEDRFDISEAGTTLATGSALAMELRSVAASITRNTALSAALELAVAWLAWPLSRWTGHHACDTAGALFLVARRRPDDRPEGV
ncbi:MAG: class I SAM-dependent methyltransferase [Myxococcaceae bacterium]|nr:MAG: class I SAM-dependent methyltransferase [Myxococcaceae bacterium]